MCTIDKGASLHADRKDTRKKKFFSSYFTRNIAYMYLIIHNFFIYYFLLIICRYLYFLIYILTFVKN